MVSAKLFAAIATITGLAAAAPTPIVSKDATSFVPPTGNGSFFLMTIAYDGDLSLSGMFVDAMPVDHFGDFSLIAHSSQPAPLFTFNTTGGDIYAYDGDNIPWSGSRAMFIGTPDSFLGYWQEVPNYYKIGLGPAQNLAPQYLNNGFSFNTENNMLRPKSYHGKTLAVCPWNLLYPDETIVTKQYGLMWRESNSTRNGTCADIHLKAIFPNGYDY